MRLNCCFKMLEHSHKLNFLKKFYPNAKILWPVRNPHSTISSMRNLVNSEGDWIDRCAIKEIERLQPFFRKELENYNLSQLSKIELGSIYWLYKNQYPIWLKNYEFDVLEFKYETLIQNQKETLEKITNFLGIDWSEDLLNFYQKNSGKSLAGGTRTDRPINETRASNLKGELNAEEINKINLICQPVMQKYSYIKL